MKNIIRLNAISNRLSGRLVAVFASVLLLLSPLTGGISPASAATGGVNVQKYCDQVRALAVALDAGNPYSWRCVMKSGYRAGVDMNAACKVTYPQSPGSARLGTWSAYGWYCVY